MRILCIYIFLVFDQFISISNKMMNLNQPTPLVQQTELMEPSRRRRVPSKYAQCIQELTKMTSKNSKKQKHSSSNDDQSPLAYQPNCDRNFAVDCIMPRTAKKIRLSIIIKKSPKPKMKKNSSNARIEKPKEKELPKNKSLLDTLLQVCEQLQEDDKIRKDDQSQGNGQCGSGNSEASRKEILIRKQRQEEEKYVRFYQKYMMLNEKLEQNQSEIIMI